MYESGKQKSLNKRSSPVGDFKKAYLAILEKMSCCEKLNLSKYCLNVVINSSEYSQTVEYIMSKSFLNVSDKSNLSNIGLTISFCTNPTCDPSAGDKHSSIIILTPTGTSVSNLQNVFVPFFLSAIRLSCVCHK